MKFVSNFFGRQGGDGCDIKRKVLAAIVKRCGGEAGGKVATFGNNSLLQKLLGWFCSFATVKHYHTDLFYNNFSLLQNCKTTLRLLVRAFI